MAGILVYGNNHFILSGPEPNEAEGIGLAGHWSIIQIGAEKSLRHEKWEIRTKEFRENLEWAVLVPGEGEISADVAQLLAEISARGVKISDYCRGRGSDSIQKHAKG
jgi:hypothetical protein